MLHMLGKQSMLLLLLAFSSVNLAAQEADENPKSVHSQALKTLAATLPQKHVTRQALNDEIGRRWFNQFIRKLDPRREYFLASDIDRLALHRDDLDDHARRGDLSFAELVRNTYTKRLRAAMDMGKEMLEVVHDYGTDEDIETAPTSYAKDDRTLRERWRKRVKYDILVQRSAGLSMEESVSTIQMRYQRISRDNLLKDDEELYELFLDAFAKSFDPNNQYYGERTLTDFRTW